MTFDTSPCKKPRQRQPHIAPGWLWYNALDVPEHVKIPETNEAAFSPSVQPTTLSEEKKSFQIAHDRIEHVFNHASLSLDLSELNLTELPKLFDELTLLTVSTATHDSQPNRFTSCAELYLSGNRLCVLPNTLFQLRQLRVLCLRRNQLSELSSNIRYLTELEELSVGDNHMNDFKGREGQSYKRIWRHLKVDRIGHT
jgi:hypothetical protein